MLSKKNKTNRSKSLLVKLVHKIVLFVPVILVLVDFWYKSFRYTGISVVPLPQSIRAIMLLIMVLYIFKSGMFFDRYNFKIGNVFNLFFLLWLIHSILGGWRIHYDVFYTIKSLFFVVFTCVVYRLYLFGYLNEKSIRASVLFVGVTASIHAVIFMSDSNVEAGQNAGSYIALTCLPFIIQDKSLKGMFFTFVTIVGILVTVKRGPALALLAGIFAFIIVYYLISVNRDKLRSVVIGMLFATFVGFIFYLLSDRYLSRFEEFSGFSSYSSEQEINRLGSGRVLMARVHYNNYLNGDLFQMIFGFGNMADFTYYAKYRGGAGLVAHSTWVETMFNYGVIGFISLLLFFRLLISMLIKFIRYKHPFSPALAMGIFILFFSSIYSSILFSTASIGLGFLIAYSSAELNLKKIG